jgi:hypothetical protein
LPEIFISSSFFACFVPFCGYSGFPLNLCVFAALREIFIRVSYSRPFAVCPGLIDKLRRKTIFVGMRCSDERRILFEQKKRRGFENLIVDRGAHFDNIRDVSSGPSRRRVPWWI